MARERSTREIGRRRPASGPQSPRGARSSRFPDSALLPAAFFLSGASALLYELLWFRLLGHVFGSTATAAATLLAAYLFGLGLGAWIFGKVSDRSRRVVLIYVAVEVGICLYGLASRGLLERGAVLYAAAHAWAAGDAARLLASRFAVSFLLIAVPTTLMGGTFPLMVQLLRGRAEDTGRAAARAYAVNTAGAALGALALPTLILPGLGLALSLVAAAGSNLAAAACVSVFAARAGVLRLSPEGAEAEDRPAGPSPGVVEGPPAGGRRRPEALLLAFFLSSFAALSLETAWSRHFGIFFGTQTVTFAFILFAYLVGLFLGGALYARARARGRPAVDLLRAGYLLSALSVAVAIPFLARLPVPQIWLMSALGISSATFSLTSAIETVVLILPPALGFGLAFPAVVGLLAEGGRRAGSSVAVTYAVNTLGTTLGAIGAGFWLIPTFGTQRAFEISVLLVAAALALTSFWVRRGRLLPEIAPGEGREGGPARARKLLGAYGIPAVFLLLLLLPRWDWRFAHGMYSKDPVNFVKTYRNGELAEALRTYRVPFLSEGTEATVSVLEFGTEGRRSLYINGKPDASSTPDDMVTQRLLGLVPALFHGELRNTLVIGLGSGTTAATLLRFPQARLEAAEIAPGVAQAAREYFSDINDRFWEDPRADLELDDGRNYLHFRPPESYDLIVSEPSNPWTAGVSALFTDEFFAEAKEKLRPGGVLCQWFHYYNMSLDHIRLILRTFIRHFPDTAILLTQGERPTGDLLLLGGKDGLRLARLPDDPTLPEGVRSALAEVKNASPEKLLWGLAAGPEDVASLAGEGLINTDDRPLLEFEAPADRFADTFVPNLRALLTARARTFLPAGAPPDREDAGTALAHAGFLPAAGPPEGSEVRRGITVLNGQRGETRELARWVLQGSEFAAGPVRTGLFRLAGEARDEGELRDIARALAGGAAVEGRIEIHGHDGIWVQGGSGPRRTLACAWVCPVRRRACFLTKELPQDSPEAPETVARELAGRFPCAHDGADSGAPQAPGASRPAE